jgi:hypothetical protein
VSMLTFSLHREVTGNEYLAVYDLLELPASKIRVGFFEIPLTDLEGGSYVRWAKAVVDGDDDAVWDTARIKDELDRLRQPPDMLTDDESARLSAELVALLPAIEPARCWLQLRFPRD